MSNTQGHDYIKRFNSLMKRIKVSIIACGMEEHANIDEDALGRLVKDYFEDIDRLKDYEKIEKTNTAKIYGYEAYWFLRRKPIYLDGSKLDDEKWVFINEIVCAMMLISKMYKEVDIKPDASDERFCKFFDLLYYNFQFREYTPKSLELMIEAFYLGCTTSKEKE